MIRTQSMAIHYDTNPISEIQYDTNPITDFHYDTNPINADPL